MEVDEALEYCDSLKCAESEFKESWESYVIKISGKVFAIIPENYDSKYYIMLKCDPEEAVLLREKYKDVNPAFHMNKKHWNMILLKGDVPEAEIKREITNSYNLVFSKLTREQKNAVNNQ